MLITFADQLDPSTIEDVLRRSGALVGGGVERVDIIPENDRPWSRMTRVAVTYRDGSIGEMPTRLLLKVCGDGKAFDDAEVRYYTRDYVGLDDAPLVRCFDAEYHDASRRYHLLLEDLSATHANRDDRDPDEGYALALGEALAALHAHRWGARPMREIGLELPRRETFAGYIDHVGRGLEPMLDLVTGEIDSSWWKRLRVEFSQLADRYAERARDERGITKLHGDLNPGNLLSPGDATRPIYLIDHQPFDWSLRCWLGASDLVYAMVVWWDTHTRRRLEMQTLRAYHDGLTKRGVDDYSFDMLIDDYRFCLIEAVAVAVEWCVLPEDRERLRPLWRMQLGRALRAIEERNAEG